MKFVVTKEHNFPRTYEVELPYETKNKIQGIVGWTVLVLIGLGVGRIIVHKSSQD